MYSYDRRVALTFGPADVEKWRSDLRRMTRIYKSIPAAPEDQRLDLYQEARGLFVNFHDHFESWVYHDLLPDRDPEKQNWRERQVATAAWTALLTLGARIFPYSWNSKTDKHEPSVHELERNIDQAITRYQRAFNIAFKEIDELLKERRESGKPGVPPPVELLHVGPVQVVIHNQGREARGADDSLDDEMRTLADAIHKIERAGFPGAVKGLTVHVSFIQQKLIAGQYDASKDELSLFPLGLGGEDNHTLIHELGHRFYYRELPSNARAHWKDVIEGRSLTLEDSDIDHMVDKYVKPYTTTHDFTPSREELHRMIDEESVELTAKLHDLEQHMPGFTQDPEEVRAFWKKNYVGNPVLLEEISDYGATNEKEAFAEAFMLYVTKGPRAVGPWTRAFFETISRAGGAKFARRVLARFLASPV